MNKVFYIVLNNQRFMVLFLLLYHLMLCPPSLKGDNLLQGLKVGFHHSMQSTNKYPIRESRLLRLNEHWKNAKYLYDKYIINNTDELDSLRIPKRIHQIWLGSSFPERCKKFQKTWLAHHPDWEYTLWTEAEIEEFGLVNQDLYNAATNFGEKSDIARYEILYRIGGLYIDTDFECLKPFDSFHYYCDFYAGVDYGKGFAVFNGLIGSAPGNNILKHCIDNLPFSKNELGGFKEILSRTGPLYFTESIKKEIASSDERIVLFPVTYFYPWPWMYRNQNLPDQINSWIKPETFAIHHWHVSWNGGTVDR
jgi:mannosyltransferase OCH1-like enzyme